MFGPCRLPHALDHFVWPLFVVLCATFEENVSKWMETPHLLLSPDTCLPVRDLAPYPYPVSIDPRGPAKMDGKKSRNNNNKIETKKYCKYRRLARVSVVGSCLPLLGPSLVGALCVLEVGKPVAKAPRAGM